VADQHAEHLATENARLLSRVRQLEANLGHLIVDADRREERARKNAEDCAEHGKEIQYLRHMASWNWASMNQQEAARRAVVMANLKSATGLRGDPEAMVRAADVAAWLEKNADAQEKVLRRPEGYPTMADCLRGGGCDHDGLSGELKAEIAEALGLAAPLPGRSEQGVLFGRDTGRPGG
jgi:hypothetical protein